MLRIAQLNDTHEGLTKRKVIRRLLLKLKQEQFDILLHCGDYSGGRNGCKLVKSTVGLIRDIFPEVPFVSVIGNHDYWSMAKLRRNSYTSPELFYQNYANILQTFADNNVWFLDTQGPYRHGDYVIVGHSGWYSNSKIIKWSNDFGFLPIGLDGDTQHYMLKKAMDGLYKNLDALTDEDTKRTLVFASHFPVIKTNEYDLGFDRFSWSASLGENLHSQYGINYFFNGHAHQYHNGPLRYETGTDYYNPKYQIVEIG